MRGLCFGNEEEDEIEFQPELELIDGRWHFESSLLSLVCSLPAPALLRLNYVYFDFSLHFISPLGRISLTARTFGSSMNARICTAVFFNGK